MAVEPSEVEFFERYGYLTGIRVHDSDEANWIRRQFDELEAREGRDKAQIGLRGRHLDQRFVWELATHPKILDSIEALIGPDVMVLSTHFFCKYPDRPDIFVAWHQDVTYWGLEPPYALTAWYAVDDSDTQNGCMQWIPGSHCWGSLEHGKSDRPGNLLSINQEVRSKRLEASRAVDFVLKAGEISIHHGHLVHGSNANRSHRRRCGLTIRYVPPYVKPVADSSLNEPWPAVLVRGEDKHKNFGEWKLEFE